MTVTLGAPGVIYVPQIAPRVLVGVRMDVAAFAGVAPRGPAFELADPHAWPFPDGVVRNRSLPVAVQSWDDYVERFGSFEGPGLLPYAVAAYFQQGGRRAHIVRIVPDLVGVSDGSVAVPGRSRYDFGAPLAAVGGGTVSLTARNEGSWGNRLTLTLSYATSAVACLGAEPSALILDPQAEVTAGAWLRLVLPDGSRVVRSVNSVQTRGKAGDAGQERVALLDGRPARPCTSSASTPRWTSSIATRCGRGASTSKDWACCPRTRTGSGRPCWPARTSSSWPDRVTASSRRT